MIRFGSIRNRINRIDVSDQTRMNQIQLETDFSVPRNSYDLPGMNSNPKLSLGLF